MVRAIGQFFSLLHLVFKQVFDLMAMIAAHGHVLHQFVAELLVLALLIAGAMHLLEFLKLLH